VGWDAQQLGGGYKTWRRHVIDTLDEIAPRLPLVVLCGATGSAKTRVLQALAARGEQVLDLEGLAAHKGSLLGALPDTPQPSQTAFETSLVDVLERMDLSRPVFAEGESRRIGRLSLPDALLERLRASPCIEVSATIEARLQYLLRDYAYLGERPEWLCAQLERMKELHGKETIARWQDWGQRGELAPLFEELALRHYDPAYARSQRKHFDRWDERRVIETQDLSDAGIDALAQRIEALQGSA